jgi:hypothetical protein
LPSVGPEVTSLIKAARDRQSEERRLAKRTSAPPDDVPGQAAMMALKTTLRAPIIGNAGLVDFLTRRAGR